MRIKPLPPTTFKSLTMPHRFGPPFSGHPMTAIDRTAYPRPGTRLTREELGRRYDLTEADLAFVRASARGDTGRLVLATLLKARRDLGCFPALEEVSSGILTHLAVQLGLAVARSSFDELRRTKSLYRYQAAVRLYLSVTAYGDAAGLLVTRTVLEAAETMSDPADLINRSIEALQAASIDLPAFSTLDRLVNRLRAEVHVDIYNRVSVRVTTEKSITWSTTVAITPVIKSKCRGRR